MQITLDNKTFDLEILRKPNKNLYIRFLDAHTMIVTCNKWVSEKEIKKIIEKNKTSLLKMAAKKEQEEIKDTFFWYLGKPYTRVFDGVSKEATFERDCIIIKDDKMLNKFYAQECVRIFQSEVNRIVPYFKNIPNFSLKIRRM